MARPKNQDARRNQIVWATLTTIADHGMAGLTSKRIAEEAGLSPRLIAYYYPDQEALIGAAHEAATEHFYWKRQTVVDGNSAPKDKLAGLMYSGLPRGRDAALSQALDEISVSASRSPLHATLMTLLFEREVSLYASVLDVGSAVGEFSLTDAPETLARNFVALEDALGLHILAHNTAMTLERAEHQLASFALTATGMAIEPVAPAHSSDSVS